MGGRDGRVVVVVVATIVLTGGTVTAGFPAVLVVAATWCPLVALEQPPSALTRPAPNRSRKSRRSTEPSLHVCDMGPTQSTTKCDSRAFGRILDLLRDFPHSRYPGGQQPQKCGRGADASNPQ